MKKYVYAGILLGTVVLAACTTNEETGGQVTEQMTEDFAAGQTVGAEPLADGKTAEVKPLADGKTAEVKPLPNGQTAKVEPLSEGKTIKIRFLSDEGEVASAAPLELTQKQKEDYYKQYVEIAAQVDAEYPGKDLTVVPIDEFKPEDWIEPEEFRKICIARAHAIIVDETQ
ncbi:hypothetical protein ACI7RC_13860 [Brevibacillus sp. B_LB10_24]|uniref:hypothetical protein n=1 Tax=Brevibacillus sp. B_LB10_24 TaxID=3380645 RepID=UPI0038B7AB0D